MRIAMQNNPGHQTSTCALRDEELDLVTGGNALESIVREVANAAQLASQA